MKVYHRIQALLYAGVYQYCDYVQYCKDKEEICVHLVVPDGNWQTTIACPELKDTVNILTFCGGKCWKLIKTDHVVLCIVNFLDLCTACVYSFIVIFL